MRVFFFEEPCTDGSTHLEIKDTSDNIWIVVPHFQHGMSEEEINNQQKDFLSSLLTRMNISRFIAWYYTPMALTFSDDLDPQLIVYDCMDELTGFKFAHRRLPEMEKALLKRADIVFTGGHSLYESKKDEHNNIHPFPSSIDYEHFLQARRELNDPEDQAGIPHPRFGFYGVIDERMDFDLLKQIALQRKDWHLILVGPVLKVSEEDLPRLDNIHFLGMKKYEELPAYLSGWDIAIMPFAINDATRFISPTKTPEFLAGGKPVISTPIADVMNQYHEVVHIAATADEFIDIVEYGLYKDETWLTRVDEILKNNSWDNTWRKMNEMIASGLKKKEVNNVNKAKMYV
jgi:UDP-galactopyranose mutase